jgi:uncharacterized membrane protein
MFLPLLLSLASTSSKTLASPAASTPARVGRPSLFEVVEQRMSIQGRPIFQRYVAQTLIPQAQRDATAQRQYIQSLHTLVAAPTLDVNAVAGLIEQRKQAEAAATSAIRSSAFAMIRTLPVSDQKLALTAIFTDARLPAGARTTPARTPASLGNPQK